jgi:hypothetical protein
MPTTFTTAQYDLQNEARTTNISRLGYGEHREWNRRVRRHSVHAHERHG